MKQSRDVIKKSVLKIIVISIIVGLNWTGLLAVGKTLAYFFDNEDSNSNLFQATILDFSVTKRHIDDFIGMEALSGIEFASVVTKKTGSLNIQYEVNAEKISGNDDFCDALKMEVKHNGVEKHDGSLPSFSASTTTELGTWEFELDLPASATNVPHGAECNVDLVFKGWRSDVVSFEESGFTDEERIELRLTSRMIVLNEFLPNPNGLVPDYGFDFGEDDSTMPRGEWVELYNNSDTSYDLANWYIWDDSGDIANKIQITAVNTNPPSTVVGAQDWLVVYMNKEVFDNDGDTVKLFNQDNKLVDSYTYTANDYCEIEPTPGDENATNTTDSCGGVPPNKSYARIPDGIGYWVDPVPTPGGPNILESEIINQEEVIEEEPIIEEEPTVEEEPIEEPIEDEASDVTTTSDETVISEEEIGAEQEPTGGEEEEPAVEEEPPMEEEELPAEEEPVVDEEPATEEELIGEETPPAEEQIPAEESAETSGETTEDVIEEVIEEAGEETTDETIIEETAEEVAEETVEESVSEPEAPVIEEPTVEDSVFEETPAVEEQPAAVPDDSSSTPDGAGESVSDGGSGDGGGETGVNSDGGSPAEGAGESSGE